MKKKKLTGTGSGKKDYKKILVDLYKEYAPEKVGTIDALLKQHKGKEEELIKKVKAKYAGGGGGGGNETKKEGTEKKCNASCTPKRCCLAGKSSNLL